MQDMHILKRSHHHTYIYIYVDTWWAWSDETILRHIPRETSSKSGCRLKEFKNVGLKAVKKSDKSVPVKKLKTVKNSSCSVHRADHGSTACATISGPVVVPPRLYYMHITIDECCMYHALEGLWVCRNDG